MMKKFHKIIQAVLVAFLLAFVFKSYLFASYVVDGESMEPTLEDGNLLMVNKVVYDWQSVDRGDVIVFHANETEDYVKRVIGTEGDHVAFQNDVLYVNGQRVSEPYLDELRPRDGRLFTTNFTLEEVTGERVVPDNHLFVMGDNRRDSLDSRYFGFVSTESIVGKVDVCYWPVSQVDLQFK